MVLGFKPQFKEPILQGTKVHTIREDKHNKWKMGNTIQIATGVRTKDYECFKEAHCECVQTIEIKWHGVFPTVYIDGKRFYWFDDEGDAYHPNDMLKLAHNDGFATISDFFKWPAFGKDFKGKIIHWTDLIY